MTLDGLVTIKQLAARRGRSTKTIRRMIEDGRLPKPTRVFACLVWDENDLRDIPAEPRKKNSPAPLATGPGKEQESCQRITSQQLEISGLIEI
jgi:predicted DNA-binding transcriptional regulator AlpA